MVQIYSELTVLRVNFTALYTCLVLINLDHIEIVPEEEPLALVDLFINDEPLANNGKRKRGEFDDDEYDFERAWNRESREFRDAE